MERRATGSGRRRYEEPSMYQLQAPPMPPPQLQLQDPQQIYIIPQQMQHNQQSSQPHQQTSGRYQGDLRELANRLGVKEGGHPPGWAESKRNKVANNKCNNGAGTSGRKNINRQLGIKLAQRGFKFSETQRTRLSEAFSYNKYPKPDEMEIIAYEINARKDQVKNWFHDQRRKYKKEAAQVVPKKTVFSAKQKRQIEAFFEKNFHPYPGDSKRMVGNLGMGTEQIRFRYEGQPLRYGDLLDPNDRVSRGFKFSDEQRMRLKNFFDQKRYPTPSETEQLAMELDVKREQVKNWFHDQRRKLKRELDT